MATADHKLARHASDKAQSGADVEHDQQPATLAACRRCALWRDATQAVPGEGPPHASIILVGEQPGDAEDVQGRPFVGPAGALLDKALEEAAWRATVSMSRTRSNISSGRGAASVACTKLRRNVRSMHVDTGWIRNSARQGYG